MININSNKKHNYFITGTNTGVGKTYIAVAMLKYFGNLGLQTLGLKPVASACEPTVAGLRNEDALLLQQYATCKLTYAEINPFAFAEPIAPHIAATKTGVELSVEKLIAQHKAVVANVSLSSVDPLHMETGVDCCIVEGAGGWLVPLNAQETIADFAVALGFPVVLVVSIELGCINHALLTYNSIIASGAQVAGWVANCRQADMLAAAENIASIAARIAAPLLSIVKHGAMVDFADQQYGDHFAT